MSETQKTLTKEKKKEAMEYRRSLYAENPSLQKYVKKRDAMVYVLFGLTVLDFFWKIIVLSRQGIYGEIGVEVFKLLVFCLIYLGALQPFAGKYFLWLPAAGNLLMLPNYVEIFFDLKMYLGYAPATVLMYVTEVIYLIGIVFTAVWRTLIEKNRRYDKQAAEIEKRWNLYMAKKMK